MKWNGKNIVDLTDDELIAAIHSVVDIDKNRLDKLSNSRERHKKIFEKHPPVENPVFTQLATELNEQFQLRQLKEI